MRYALRIRGARVAGTVALAVETLAAARAMARAWAETMKRPAWVSVVDAKSGEEVWTEESGERGNER
jgi:hypothetical protein